MPYLVILPSIISWRTRWHHQNPSKPFMSIAKHVQMLSWQGVSIYLPKTSSNTFCNITKTTVFTPSTVLTKYLHRHTIKEGKRIVITTCIAHWLSFSRYKFQCMDKMLNNTCKASKNPTPGLAIPTNPVNLGKR